MKNVLIKITIKYFNFNTSLCQHIYSLDGGNNSERQADFSAKKNQWSHSYCAHSFSGQICRHGVEWEPGSGWWGPPDL